MGIYDRDYMHERHRERERAEDQRRSIRRPAQVQQAKRMSTLASLRSYTPMLVFWLAISGLLWLGFNLLLN